MGGRDWAIASFEGDLARGIAGGHARGREAFETFANLWLTAIETDQAWPRLRSWSAAKGLASPDEPIRVIELRHGERDDPEPAALPLAAAAISNRLGRRIEISAVPLAELSEAPPGVLAILRGIEPPAWGGEAWEAIERYLALGGTLLVETPGGRGEFTAAVEAELSRRLGSPPRPIAGGEPPGGVDAAAFRRVAFRSTTAREEGAASAASRVRAISIGGRIGVLSSREDLSTAWLARPREGLHGYAPAAAIDLLEQIVRIGMANRASSPPPSGP